jgi:hypothetical protein
VESERSDLAKARKRGAGRGSLKAVGSV